MNNNDEYLVRHAQVASRVVDGQAVIVLSDTGEVQILNEVGTRVWELIDGNHSVRQIAEIIADEFEVTPEDALADTQTFVEKLQKAGAIELRQ